MNQKPGCNTFPPCSPLPGLYIRCLKVPQGRKDTVTGCWQFEHWQGIKSVFISTQVFISLCLGTLLSSKSNTGRAHPKEGSLGGLEEMMLWA